MNTPTATDVRAIREQLILDHMRTENEQVFDETLATFSHARYELIATGEVHDGFESVAAYYTAGRRLVPDQRNELIELHHTDSGVIIEFWLRGTPVGEVNPEGRSFKCRMVAIFTFDDDNLLTGERVYFDSATIMRQLAGELPVDEP